MIVALIYLGVCVIYYFLQEKFIFVPTWTGEFFETRISSRTAEFNITTEGEGHIHAMLVHADNPKGLIFYLHGNTGSLNRWQFMAEEIAGYGFDVFVPDYRGYGKSHGPRSEGLMHRDIEYCYDFIQSHYPDQPVVVYGRSLGCAFATKLTMRKRPLKLVLETPFYNMSETGRHYLPFLPIRLLLRYKFRNDIYIRHIDCPIQIFHGTRDIVVPHSHALKLFQLAQNGGCNVRMTTIVGGKHSNLNSYPLFRERLEDFLSASVSENQNS